MNLETLYEANHIDLWRDASLRGTPNINRKGYYSSRVKNSNNVIIK